MVIKNIIPDLCKTQLFTGHSQNESGLENTAFLRKLMVLKKIAGKYKQLPVMRPSGNSQIHSMLKNGSTMEGNIYETNIKFNLLLSQTCRIEFYREFHQNEPEYSLSVGRYQ